MNSENKSPHEVTSADFKKRRATLSIIAAFFFLLAVGATSLRVFDRLELSAQDIITRTTRVKAPIPPIKVVLIDQQSLQYFSERFLESWPVPRSMYIPVLRFLEKAKAKAIAFDMLFTESNHDRLEDDKQFAEAIKDLTVPVVLGAHAPLASTISEPSDALIPDSSLPFKAFRERQEKDARPWLVRLQGDRKPAIYSEVLLPIPELADAAHGIGNTVANPDSDGVFRRVVPGGRLAKAPLLSLPFALYAAGSPNDLLKETLTGEPLLDDFLTTSGELIPRFYRNRGDGNTLFPSVSMSSVIESMLLINDGKEPLVPLSEFENAWVLIGSSAPGLKDLRPTSVSSDLAGVFFHGAVLDNLLGRDFMRELPGTLTYLLLLTFFITSVAVQLLVLSRFLQVSAVIALIVAFVGAHFGLAHFGYLTPVIAPTLMLFLSMSAAFAYQYHQEGAQRRFLKKAFSHYLSNTVIDQILEDPKKLTLGGECRELTLFFSDIRGFSSLSENLTPESLVALLNDYLTLVTDCILESGGTLDKYEGDAIIAFWNAPLTINDHHKRAIETSVEIQHKLKERSRFYEQKYGAEIHTRIGLHAGEVVVGNVGTTTRFNYTFIGDAGNVASRLEGTNKVFGTSLLYSESMYATTKTNIPSRKIGSVIVVGKAVALTVYEPLALSALRDTPELLTQYSEALSSFDSGDWEKALQQFRAISSTDPVSASYVSRIEAALEGGDQKRDPVWRLLAK